MKTFMQISTSATVLLALSAASSVNADVGEPICSCSATCTASGDPHITDFEGKEWQDTDTTDQVFLYEIDNFKVIADVDSAERIGTVKFGSTSYEATNCESEETSWTDYKDLGSKYGYVNIAITCSLVHEYYHLDVVLTKTDTGSTAPDFMTTETDLGATGLCVTGPTSRRLRASRRLNSESTISCSCSSQCTLTGDPHITSFYDKTERITSSGDETVYSEGSFQIIASVSDERIRTISFGNDTPFSASDCENDETPVTKTQSWSNGDSLVLVATCETKGSSSDGWFYNIEVTKTDVTEQGSDDTFRSIEISEKVSGLCELGQ